MNTLVFLLSIIVLIATGIIAKKYIYNLKKFIPILLSGMVIALGILVFPLHEGTPITKFVFSIIYAAQSIILGEDLTLLKQINIQSIIDIAYIGIIYVLFLVMPLLTVSFLLSLIDDFMSKAKLFVTSKREVIIFTELNAKSVMIAEKMDNKKKTFIFANCKDNEQSEFNKRIKDIKGLKLEEVAQNINLKLIRGKEITFFAISDNPDENLNKTLQLIEKYKDREIKICLTTYNEMARTILDSTDKGKIRVEIINEIERIVYQVLEDKPLYLNTINNEISVLIVGAGVVGQEFLKAITWCGQIIGYNFKITVMDLCANKIKEKLEVECPELLENYNYNFIEVDVNSQQMVKELENLNDINYIVVSLNDEELNLNKAIWLRRYFILQDKQKYNHKPIINVYIQDDLKNAQISTLKNERNNQYDLNAFGSIRQMYFENPILDSKLENMTKKVHLAWCPNDTKLKKFYEREYNIKSSRASALHIMYKIYSMLGKEFTGNEEDLPKVKELLKNEQVIEDLSRNEHDRWMAYMRSDGYRVATIEDVEKYKNITNDYRNHLAKMHPALVDYDLLDGVGKAINVDLKSLDRGIIEKIPQIISE